MSSSIKLPIKSLIAVAAVMLLPQPAQGCHSLCCHVISAVSAVQNFINDEKFARQLELQQDGGVDAQAAEQPAQEPQEDMEKDDDQAADDEDSEDDVLAQYKEQVLAVRIIRAHPAYLRAPCISGSTMKMHIPHEPESIKLGLL